MPFESIEQFRRSFPGVSTLTPEQQRKALAIFNAMQRERPGADDGQIIAVAISRAKELNSDMAGNIENPEPQTVESKDGKKVVNIFMKEDLLNTLSFASLNESGESIIEVLRTGKIQDRGLQITKGMLEDFIKHFREDVYGQGRDIPVNLSHNREGEAAGWVRELFLDGESLMARIEWTELGRDKLSKKLFKFISAELAGIMPNHKTGEKIKNV